MKPTQSKAGSTTYPSFTGYVKHYLGLDALPCAALCRIAQDYFPAREIFLKTANTSIRQTAKSASMSDIIEMMELAANKGAQITFEANSCLS